MVQGSLIKFLVNLFLLNCLNYQWRGSSVLDKISDRLLFNNNVELDSFKMFNKAIYRPGADIYLF